MGEAQLGGMEAMERVLHKVGKIQPVRISKGWDDLGAFARGVAIWKTSVKLCKYSPELHLL